MELYIIITLAIGFLVTKHIEVDVVHCLADWRSGRFMICFWIDEQRFADGTDLASSAL